MVKPIQIKFPKYADINGVLCVYQVGEYVPFDIRRVFVVTAGKDDIRGEHAHKQCNQLLVCVAGEILVSCDDGVAVTQYRLADMETGLLIPPGIWAKEEYIRSESALMVFCDREYEPDDYLRNYDDFKKYIETRKLK
jgi:hypothetical protein